MPARPSYWKSLPTAIATLEQSTALRIGRADLEEMLCVSKTVAWRLLRQCAPETAPGGALFCDRGALLARLRELVQQGAVEFELGRRNRLESQLSHMRQFIRSKEIKVAVNDQVAALRSTRFQNLPPNVVLTAQSLHIEFGGSEDFLAAIGGLVFALQNDYDAIRSFIDGD